MLVWVEWLNKSKPTLCRHWQGVTNTKDIESQLQLLKKMMGTHLIHVHPVNKVGMRLHSPIIILITQERFFCSDGRVQFVHQYSTGNNGDVIK